MTGAPSFDRAYLTKAGRQLLEERIRQLEATVDELQRALSESDRSDDAVDSCRRAARELDQLRLLLTTSGAVEENRDDPRVVELGDTVTIRLDDGAEETYIIVHPAEAPLEDQRMSVQSPLGHALLGRHVGETIEVPGPAGSYRCAILRATRRAEPAAG